MIFLPFYGQDIRNLPNFDRMKDMDRTDKEQLASDIRPVATDIKLVATDIDGTLLNSGGELSDEFYPFFEKLKKQGILFAAASGRQYYNLLKQFESIQDDTIFIAENGSYVVYRGEDVYVRPLAGDMVKTIITMARQIEGTSIVLCGKKKAYYETDEPGFISHIKKYYERRERVDDLLNLDGDEFLKIAICDPLGSEANSYPHFKPLEDELQVKISGSIWLDLSHRLANKGKALEMIQEKYGVTVGQTMAFGDYLNDLEMMQQAYFSYAMGNAHPAVKEAARFITKSNDEDGVINILRGLVDRNTIQSTKID